VPFTYLTENTHQKLNVLKVLLHMHCELNIHFQKLSAVEQRANQEWWNVVFEFIYCAVNGQSCRVDWRQGVARDLIFSPSVANGQKVNLRPCNLPCYIGPRVGSLRVSSGEKLMMAYDFLSRLSKLGTELNWTIVFFFSLFFPLLSCFG